ncbi:MAG TPA: phytanoyl-CoA dioxygenase family protein [Candidatus Latescibacteria bacterium]|jgi:ectoine hydroxylase-related dioxygenase (phytanoyl-CoA dioxygenase family)|nr:phytanoyl-CoA dioxygenase family protein [Gemmatimonadaceae bacterium]MDP6018527.1 phytanoyl-CoA dioxygenase family protein [Candidatus Latescibacterota bacterium]HJP29379.1 phytanoyl-CoA dioxygenase family protein [Candidatus Latescibacterota bacterium]
MSHAALSAEQVAAFHRDGYLMLRDHFPVADMERMLRVARTDQELSAGAADRRDSEGRVSRLSLRYSLDGDDAFRAYARHERIVEPLEQLLGSELYHYHHKMMMKEPHTGGAWEWHQDFGYWYGAFLFPDMGSCMIAVDRASKANGCLQVLRGSHRLGRLDHGATADQVGTDAARVKIVEEHFDLVHCEMDPGTVLFFHSNTLHRSDANTSPDPRWALICCYTAVDNTPFKQGAAGEFAPFERWDDERVRGAVLDHEERLTTSQSHR